MSVVDMRFSLYIIRGIHYVFILHHPSAVFAII